MEELRTLVVSLVYKHDVSSWQQVSSFCVSQKHHCLLRYPWRQCSKWNLFGKCIWNPASLSCPETRPIRQCCVPLDFILETPLCGNQLYLVILSQNNNHKLTSDRPSPVPYVFPSWNRWTCHLSVMQHCIMSHLQSTSPKRTKSRSSPGLLWCFSSIRLM